MSIVINCEKVDLSVLKLISDKCFVVCSENGCKNSMIEKKTCGKHYRRNKMIGSLF